MTEPELSEPLQDAMNTVASPAATAQLTVRNPWALVPPIGNLDAYISATHRIPLLTAQEEADFARRLREHGDLEAAGRLVLSHLRLVVSVSRQYLGYGLPQGDLIQEGNVGLMKAVKRFDPDQGVRLVSLRATLSTSLGLSVPRWVSPSAASAFRACFIERRLKNNLR